MEEAGEIIDEAIEGMGEEADAAAEEGLDAEEVAEVEAEAQEASAASRALGEVVEGLKALGNFAGPFIKFVVKNVAIGAIFYGVTVALKKLTAKEPGNQQAKQQFNKIKSVSDFIRAASDLSKKVSDWLKEHEKDYITLEGIQVPLISIFARYTDPLADVC